MPIIYISKQVKWQTTLIYPLEECRTGAASWDFLLASSLLGNHSPGPQVYPGPLGQMRAPFRVWLQRGTFQFCWRFSAWCQGAGRALDLIGPVNATLGGEFLLVSKPAVRILWVILSSVGRWDNWLATSCIAFYHQACLSPVRLSTVKALRDARLICRCLALTWNREGEHYKLLPPIIFFQHTYTFSPW